jgi:uncharacterized repeat protein (TIGR03843 family)
MPWSSNATFLVTLGGEPVEQEEPAVSRADGDDRDDWEDEEEGGGEEEEDDDDEGQPLPSLPLGAIRGIYKPGKGERPLWDFPRGLYRREVAAYELSVLLGWDVIPPTVVRLAEYGVGSLQFFVETNFSEHYFTFLEREHHHPALKRLAAFDIIANNTDRKGGHVLADRDGHLWGIDNGLCFNEEPKLRTVIWDFAGESIPHSLLKDITRLLDRSPDELGQLNELLSADEIGAMYVRAQRLVNRGELPAPRSDYAYPWPLV